VLVGVADACIIDQYIYAAEDVGRRGDRARRGRGISDVAHHHASIATRGVYEAQGFVQFGGRPTDTNNSGATGRELPT
jgi:hypothetical protein